MVGKCSVFPADQLKQRQFQKRDHFHQWKDHGKHQHHAPDEPFPVQKQFANAIHNAALAPVAQLFDGDNGQQNRRPKQHQRRASKSSAPHRSQRVAALESSMAPRTICAMPGFHSGNRNDKAAGVANNISQKNPAYSRRTYSGCCTFLSSASKFSSKLSYFKNSFNFS